MKHSNYLFGALTILAGIFLFTDIANSIMSTILSVIGVGILGFLLYNMITNR